MKKGNKKEEKGSKFMTGALIGTVLGVAAGVFATSKTGKAFGKQVKNEIGEKSAEFYKFIIPKLKKAQKMSEKEYKAFIKEAIVAFNRNKKLTSAEVKELMTEAQRYWKLLKKHF